MQKDSSSYTYTDTQAHQFIPSSIGFLNSLHVPFGIHSLQIFTKLILASTFSPECAENSRVSGCPQLCIPRKDLKEEPKPHDFPKPSSPFGIFDGAILSLLLGYLIQHQGRSPTELQKQGLKKTTLFLGLLECPNLFFFFLFADFPFHGTKLS